MPYYVVKAILKKNGKPKDYVALAPSIDEAKNYIETNYRKEVQEVVDAVRNGAEFDD